MKKKNFLLTIAAATASFMFASCSQDADDFSSTNKSDLPSQQLDVNFAIEGMKTTTRAAITPVNAWTNGANIGVTVYKNNTAGDLMKTGTQNLKWSYDGSNWTGETPTYFFPGEEGYVTAYYPWADAINPTAISIDNTKDWMYAKLTDNKHVAYGSPQTSLTMNHATAQIKVNFIRKGYVGNGNVTSLTVTSPKMASAATLNSTTGALSGHTLISNFTENFDKTLGADDEKTAALHESFVPVDDAAADVVFNATVDGLKLKCVISQKFDQGKIYTFNLNVTDDLQEMLQINEVTITAWGDINASGDLELVVPPAESKAIDLGLPSGLKWAAGNVGAKNPQDPGLYFAWGETEGYAGNAGHNFAWANYKWSVGGSSSNFSKYNSTGVTLDLEDDAAHVNLGGSWRMPTTTEIDELINNTTRTWTTNYEGTGVAGYIVKSKTNSNQIFMPAAGYCGDSSLYYFGSDGYYWSSSQSAGYSSNGFGLGFDSGSFNRDGYGRFYGFSVRGVCE